MYTAWQDGAAVLPEESSFTAPLPGPPRIESCYRSFEMQEWWRNFYCFFGELRVRGGARARACTAGAAPSTSRTAAASSRSRRAGYQWLKANAWRFGFVHPAWAEPGGSSPEPWHWEHA